MKDLLYPPNRRCFRCGAGDIPVYQRSLPNLTVRYCGPCWRELVDLILTWQHISLNPR